MNHIIQLSRFVSCMSVQEEKYAHSYAYDWRTKLPTIYRATDQWFASIDGFRYVAAVATRYASC
jgi:isoleucyl-tRNA synthetase